MFASSFSVAAFAAGFIWMTSLSSVEGASKGFAFSDTDGESVELTIDGKPVARYMYVYDPEDRRYETFKPFLHILDSQTGQPITKAHRGRFSHHRGIFVGWNRVRFEDQSYDFWHMEEAAQIHRRFSNIAVTSDQAELTSVVDWTPLDQAPWIRERRTMTFRRLADPGIVLVDLKVRLEALRGDLQLHGDPEHAGVQYRPHQDVTAEETRYFFPREDADPTEDVDYPWVGQTHTLKGKRYSVVHLNHPNNPKGTRYSAYRDYGRFGAFFETDLKESAPLTLRYRFAIKKGKMFPESRIESLWEDFAKD